VTYQLLALDLDGTILDRSLELDPRLRNALRLAASRGLHVTLATGRMPPGSRRYWEELDIRAPVILYNGALVRDPGSGENLLVDALPAGIGWTAYAAYANAPVHPLFFCGDTLYCLERTQVIVRYCADQGLEIEEICNREAFLAAATFSKCLFIGHPDVLPILRADLEEVVDGARLATSRPDYLELLPANASKGKALAWVAQHLGISLARTIAVGDQENDLEMLRAAGIGVAMPHAPEGVRAAADRIAPLPEAGGLLALLAELSPEHFA
jgi:Cof subfamily protein (haloacid dehalogenase superfamily)